MKFASADVWDFKYSKAELQYVWLHRDIEYVTRVDGGPTVNNPLAKPKITTAKGHKFALYVHDHHIVFTQVKPDTIAVKTEDMLMDALGMPIVITGDKGVTFGAETGYYFRKADGTLFVVEFFDQKSGRVPAFRLGCKNDTFTDARTCVNRWHDALPYLEKSLKSVSEFDLTTALHNFPQKIQYVGKCRATGCISGYLANGETCGTCQGSGIQTITTAQDHITYPLPKNAEDMRDLSQLVHYVALPVDLIQQMRDIIKDTKQDAIKAVFGSDIFSRDQVSTTATGKMIDMQSVYDALQPFAAWWAQVRTLTVYVFAAYHDKANNLRVVFRFPRNFKFDTVDELTARLEKLKDASPSVRSMVNMDLLAQLYVDDPKALKKAQTMERFNPYPGMSDGDVLALIGGGHAVEKNALLWTEKASVFLQAEMDYEGKAVGFYDLDEAKQKEVIDAIVDAMMEERTTSAPEFAATTGVDAGAAMDAVPGTEAVQDTALNGAQVSSLIEVINQVATGILTKETARAIINAAFPGVDDGLVDQMINGVKPVAPEKVNPPPPSSFGGKPKPEQPPAA